MNLSIIGTGYVGLVTGLCLAKLGHNVTCMDIDEAKIANLRKGISPIYEPGTDELITSHNVTYTTDTQEAVKGKDAIFLALPTPPGEDGSADLSYILGAAQSISQYINTYTVIINKSTVPVGSAERVTEVIGANTNRTLFDVVSNPEFLREGKAIDDFLHPDRVVIGSESKTARDVVGKIYEPIQDRTQIIYMDTRSAEMTKYVANTFLGMKISFINEMSRLAEWLGADIEEVKRGIGSDHRIGPHFINPGIGYGGSCFPKDILALEKMTEDSGHDLDILPMIIKGNKKQKDFFYEKIQSALNGDISGKTIAIWGLAFKPDTDDIREAPALDIISRIVNDGGSVKCHDPEAVNNVRQHFGPNDSISYYDEKDQALEGSDALVLITEWDCYKTTEIESIKNGLRGSCIIDGRNIFDKTVCEQKGLRYYGIGRK